MNPLETYKETLGSKSEPPLKKSYKELYMCYNKNYSKKGYFVVGWELFGRLYLNLESYGYTIPFKDKNNKHRIRPDKSIQKTFYHFLVKRYIDLSNVYEYGELLDLEDQSVFRILHFRNKYIPDFVEFFDNEWLIKIAPVYFKTRDKTALPYLRFLIVDPVFITNHSENYAANETKKLPEKELKEECKRVVIAGMKK